MDLVLVTLALAYVIFLYFRRNPLKHSSKFMMRRFVNWFPLGMSYAFLYFARYNLNVSANALGARIDNADFGIIFGVGTFVYGCSFLLTGPLVDTIGGKKGMLIATVGASLMNMAMGLVTYMALKGVITSHLVLLLSIFYALNMFFQSYGAVSIIKVKSYWFHVRERGVFGAIFGTLISFGVYFAFDWGSAIANAASLNPKRTPGFVPGLIRTVFAVDTGTTDAIWLVFFIPAVLLLVWALIDLFVLKDLPSQANFEDFDTHDASSGEMEREYTKTELLKKIFTHPVLLTVAAIEFTSGVTRNGIMQWYFRFADKVPQVGAEMFKQNWGLLTCLCGIAGGFLAGWMSDRLFQSRRGPVAGIMNGGIFIVMTVMAIFLMTSPITVGVCALLVVFTGIGVHSIMSGTAGADFGGRKAAATAAGITDGFVYLGTGLQSVCVGYISQRSWQLWPVFLIPFALLGVLLALRIWRSIPEATKRYIDSTEDLAPRMAGNAPRGMPSAQRVGHPVVQPLA